MRRQIRVFATDGDVRITITARLDTSSPADGGLTAGEVSTLRADLADRLMLTLKDLRYTRYRLHEIKVT